MAIRYCSHNYTVFPNNACPNCGTPVWKLLDSYDTSIESYIAREKMFSISTEQEHEILRHAQFYASNQKVKLLLLAIYCYIRRHQPALVDLKNNLESEEDYWTLLLMLIRG